MTQLLECSELMDRMKLQCQRNINALVESTSVERRQRRKRSRLVWNSPASSKHCTCTRSYFRRARRPFTDARTLRGNFCFHLRIISDHRIHGKHHFISLPQDECLFIFSEMFALCNHIPMLIFCLVNHHGQTKS